MIRIYPEQHYDYIEAEYLLDLAFGQARLGLGSYRFRDGLEPIRELSLIAKDEFMIIVGVIRFWPVTIGKSCARALLLGPLGVHPTRQGEGIGSVLIRESLHYAKRAGWTRVILIGDKSYYSRFGFNSSSVEKIIFGYSDNSERLLGLELETGAFSNVHGVINRWAD